MALRDVSNITPNSTPRRLSTTPQNRKRALAVSPTSAVTSTAKKDANLPYASTLPTFDIEYSPCAVKNVPFLALRGLGLTDSYFENPGRYFPDEQPPAAKRSKPFVAPAPPPEKPDTGLTPLSSRLSELRFSKISFKRNAEPKTINNNQIFKDDDEPSLNSSEMGDITLDKMIDAILESAKKDHPKRSSSLKSKQPKIPSPTYTAADDPASDLYKDTLIEHLPPKLIAQVETTIILEESTNVNEREVKTPEPTKTSKSLRQSLTRFVLASPLDACHLRRQKAVRRKNKPDQVEKEPAEKKPCRIGLTLPNGIPSPETPKTVSFNQSRIDQLAQMKTPTDAVIVVDSDLPASKSALKALSTIDEMTPSIRSIDLQGTSTPTGSTDSIEKTRKCLAFSPTLSEDSLEKRRSVASSTTSRCSRSASVVKGSLDLHLRLDEDASPSKLHVHVIRCRDLQRGASTGGSTINAYVKVAVVNASSAGGGADQGFQRTAVHRNSSKPIFDHRFVFELDPGVDEDDGRRVQLAVWHRDRECKRSEFLGCMSFPLKKIKNEEINGSYKMQPQSSLTNPTPPVPDLCENSQTSVEESVGVDEAPIYVNVPGNGQLESISLSKKALHQRDADENLFLRFLELDETAEATNLGRTPFTITKKLTRTADKGFGFSVVWTHPPRIEKVEPGLSAEKVGILPGDYIVFVDKHNVVTMPELDVLNLIRTQGNTLQLEVFRRPLRPISLSHDPFNTRQEDPLPKLSATPPRLTATCSNVSLESAKRKLNLPQVAFTKEVGKGVLV